MNQSQLNRSSSQLEGKNEEIESEANLNLSSEAIRDRALAKTEVIEDILTLQVSARDYRDFGINE